MTASQTEIFNMALFNIGHSRRVNTVAEDTPEAKNCRAVYGIHRRALLTMAKWSFAKSILPLALTGNEVVGYDYEYTYPPDCLKALEIARSSKDLPKVPFQTGSTINYLTNEQSRVIWTNEASAQLVFMRDVNVTGLFTPLFDQTLAYRMSVDLARVMATREATAKEMLQLFQFSFNQAILSGEAEAEDEPAPDAAWIIGRDA